MGRGIYLSPPLSIYLMLRNLFILLLLLVGLSIWLWVSGAGRGDADLRYISAVELRTLDPQRMTWLEDIRVAECMFEGLVRVEVPSLQIGPATASHWSMSPDGLTYTFHLRPDARFTNGDPVTSEDFRFAWRRAMMPDSAADYAQLFFVIKGAREFFAFRSQQLATFAKSTNTPGSPGSPGIPGSPNARNAQKLLDEALTYFDQHVGIKAPDTQTLVVTLENPCSYFLELLGFITFVPVHRESVQTQMTLDAGTGLWSLDPMWTRAGRVIGNGPYVLERRRFKRDIRLIANPHYWNRAAMGNQSILMQIVGDHGAAMLAYQRGDVDWLPDIPTASPLAADLMRQAREGLRNDVHVVQGAGTYFYNFNCAPTFLDGSKNPLHDVRVRQALSLALDRRTIVERVTRGFQPMATTFVPPGALAGYEPPVDALIAGDDLQVNLARARKLLEEAGYPGGRGLTGLSILYNTEGAHGQIAQQIKNHWEQTLGVSVNLTGVEKTQFGQRLRSHDFAISRAGWFGDYRDPTTFLDKFISDNGNNDAQYHNPQFDDLMRQAARELDPQARMRILETAERLMLTEQPIAPIYHYTMLSVHDAEKVQGLLPNAWGNRRQEWVKVTR